MSKRKSKSFNRTKQRKKLPREIPKKRKFNGKIFQFENEFSYKSDAQSKAKIARRAGFNARVTKTASRGGGYRLYLRKKSRK